jgi:hypothetical protein
MTNPSPPRAGFFIFDFGWEMLCNDKAFVYFCG